MKRIVHDHGTWQRRARLNQWYCWQSNQEDWQWYPAEVCHIRFQRQGTTYSVSAGWRNNHHVHPPAKVYEAVLAASDPFGMERTTLAHRTCLSFEEARKEMVRIMENIDSFPAVACDIMEHLL